jgi:hypothetical protein
MTAGAVFAFQERVIPGDPPGGMRLLEGYSHERKLSYDTQTGRIWKEGGPQIRYDIGKWAGHHARSLKDRGRFIWSKKQTFNGHPVHLTMENERRLVVTFDEDHANFFVDNVKNQEDLADVLLMLMTYTPSPPPQQ